MVSFLQFLKVFLDQFADQLRGWLAGLFTEPCEPSLVFVGEGDVQADHVRLLQECIVNAAVAIPVHSELV